MRRLQKKWCYMWNICLNWLCGSQCHAACVGTCELYLLSRLIKDLLVRLIAGGCCSPLTPLNAHTHTRTPEECYPPYTSVPEHLQWSTYSNTPSQNTLHVTTHCKKTCNTSNQKCCNILWHFYDISKCTKRATVIPLAIHAILNYTHCCICVV